MKKSNISKRFPISTALKEEHFTRLQKVRNSGYTVPDIVLLGIKSAERKIQRKK